MDDPVWISAQVALAIHEAQLAEHGGRQGPTNIGALESALHRPQNILHYGEADLAELAAAYALGLAKDHPFTDGNKRVSSVVTELFLRLNGFDLGLTDEQVVTLWLDLAAGAVGEAELASTIRSALVAR